MNDQKPVNTSTPRKASVRTFWLLAYGLTFVACTPFFAAMDRPDLGTALYSLAIWVTYPALYLLPALALTWIARAGIRLLIGREGRSHPPRWSTLLVNGFAILCVSGTLALLVVDQRIHALYGFHINGFVLNIVTTEGGLESMGAGRSTYVVVVLGGCALLMTVAALFWLSQRVSNRVWGGLRMKAWLLVPLLLLFSAGERVAYGVANVRGHVPILVGADAFPLYSRLTFNSLAEDLGFGVSRDAAGAGFDVDLGEDSGQLAYPLEPLAFEEHAATPNIVWVAVESWRWDTLVPEVMPRTSEFAAEATSFAQHYSGGNGTRMGVFSMFYGLYGSYWFSMLDQRRGPVLIDALLEKNYQMSVNTSAKFTYPEFDKTVFARVAQADLTEWSGGPGWERDRANIGGVLQFIEDRDPTRPFFTFSFLESPHARYTFPEECVVAEPYLDDFNYATMSLEEDIEGIRNRYLNACNHLDSQIGRLVDALKDADLMENTILVLTGDHGEEFLEKGHWGHGSTFVEEQIRVPLVLHVPGREPARVERLTSHLDIPATILPLLGVSNEPAQLSQGIDLLGSGHRDHVVLADWSRICVLTDTLKTSLPLKAKGFFRNEVTTRNDQKLQGKTEMPVWVLRDVLAGLAQFRRKPAW